MSRNSAPPATPSICFAFREPTIAPVTAGERWTRGQRFGMIAFGSRTELYVPETAGWEPAVALGRHVKGGKDVLMRKQR